MTKSEKAIFIQHMEKAATEIGAAKLEGNKEVLQVSMQIFDSFCALAKDLGIYTLKSEQERVLARGLENAKMREEADAGTETEEVPANKPQVIDYDKQKQAFLELAKVRKFQKSDIAIYLCLLDLWKKKGWQEWIHISNSILGREVHNYIGTVIGARRRLEENGLFESFYAGHDGGYTGTGYKLHRLYAE